MRKSTLLILILFVAALVLGGVYFFGTSYAPKTETTAEVDTNINAAAATNVNLSIADETEVTSPPPPSDDIDVIIGAIFADAELEQTTVVETDDTSLFIEDEQALLDVGQSYSANDIP